MKSSRLTGFLIMLCGLVYSIVETRYFGSHWLPKSPDEILADGLALIIVSLGAAVVSLSQRKA